MIPPAAFERELAMLVDRAFEGHLLAREDGTILFANAAAHAILAADGGELENTALTRWMPELDIHSGLPVLEVESEAISAKDDRFPVEYSLVPVDEGRGLWGVVFRDISRRKGFEGSIRSHAEELEKLVRVRTQERDQARNDCRLLYDLAPVLDFELDSQGSIASANRESCLLLGVSVDRLVGLPLSELAVPDKRDDLEGALEKLRQGSQAPFEARLRSADGAVIDVAFRPVRTHRSGRASTRIVGIDVTARREAERLVDQSLDLAEAQRARMERILRGIGEGVVVTDPDGQVRLMNRIAEQFLDIDERFAFGRDLFSEQRDETFVERWKEFNRGEEDILTCELNVGGSNGHVFTVTTSRIRTPEGRPAGCVSVLRDVTRERQIERMKRDFVSNITHELRTPLASIRGFVATILRSEDMAPADSRRFLGIVEKEAERLQHLIEDLLVLSSLEAGRETLNLRPADLSEILRDAEAMFTPMALEKGITLSVDTAGQNGSGIFDPEKIRRVLDNLIGNAMKFTPSGGRVDVELRRKGEMLQCTVRDTGKGMDREVLGRIFDRFYTSTPAQGNPLGTGLGLHIVQRLVELHGGRIDAQSQPGEGSTFCFFFPAVPRAQGPQAQGTRSGTAAATGQPAASAPERRNTAPADPAPASATGRATAP